MTARLLEESHFSSGGETLFHRSVTPARGKPSAHLCLLHGYGDHCYRYRHVFDWFVDREVACHSYDFRGHGRSTGKRGHVRAWWDYLDDLARFLELLAPATGEGAPLFILGHSHGALVLADALLGPRPPSARGFIFSSPFFQLAMPLPRWKRVAAARLARIWPACPIPSGIVDEWLSSDPDMIAETRADPLRFKLGTPRWFLEAQRAQARVISSAQSMDIPTLMLCGTEDRIADIAVSRRAFDEARSEDKTLRCYRGFRHELLRERGRETVFEDVVSWIRARS